MNNDIEKTDNKQVISYSYEEKLRNIFSDGTSENTIKSYKSDLNYFVGWAFFSGLNTELPFHKDDIIRFIVEHMEGIPEDVDNRLVEDGIKQKLGTHAISTIQRRIASLSSIHNLRNLENPCESKEIKILLKKSRTASVKRGWKPNQKSATTADVIEKIILSCEESNVTDVRDKAIILFAFSSGGRRRSEVVSVKFEDIQKIPEGYLYTLPYSKSDQTGQERLQVPIIGQAAKALEKWINLLDDKEGFIFKGLSPRGKILDKGITDKTFARIVKKRVKMAGYDEKDFSGHSIRAGFMTEGGRKNINLMQLMELSGHKSVQIAKRYYRGGNLLHNPAARILDDD
jgi:integrase